MRFQDIIAPIPLTDLLNWFTERPTHKVWQSHSDVSRLFGWSDLNILLTQQRINDMDVIILRHGIRVHPAEITERVRRKSGMANQLSSEKLLSVLKQGGTIRISRIDEKCDRLESLATEIEALLDCQVNINLYASFGTVPALLAHTDTHDVLVIQIDGKKKWKVFGFGDNPFPIRDSNKLDCPSQLVWSDELEKGGVLFMPRGSWHRAYAEGGTPSLHITIGFNHTMLYDLHYWLEKKLARYPFHHEHLLAWRAGLDSDIEDKIRNALSDILAPGFLSLYRRDRREAQPERLKVNLPYLEDR